MTKRLLSVILVMLMLLPMVLTLVSCEKERTEEEIINDIVNSGTTALTLSIWIPTNSNTDSQAFKDQLTKVQEQINNIFRDKNLSTEIKITAVSTDNYEEELAEHLKNIEEKVAEKNGLLPSNVSQGYVNKAVKVPYGDSYMYELAYPSILDTQIDLFLIRDYENYVELAQKENLYALDSYLSIDGGRYPDIRKMISPAVLAKYTQKNSIYAIPNNHLYTNAQYQYILIDKSAFDSVEGMDISTITDIYSCEAFIEAISSNINYVPFVGTLNDASGVYMFDDSNLVGSSFGTPDPSSIFDVEAYTNYVSLYKKLNDKSLVKESLAAGEKAAVSFFYGTNEEVKAYEENYYVVKTEKPVADVEDIYSSMFAISKYSANYDRAMRVLYLLQTDTDIITLLQYGIKGEDYKLEYDNNGDERIVIAKDTPYNMTGINIGNSYLTYINDGSTIDEWDLVKEANYDLSINPYLLLLKNFDANATEEEKAQLSSLTESIKSLAAEVNADINSMSYETFIAFLNAYNELATVYPDIENIEKEITALNEAMQPNRDKLAELEAKIAPIVEILKPTTDRIAEIKAEIEGLLDASETESERIAVLEEELNYLSLLIKPEADKLKNLEAELATAKEAEVVDEELVAKLENEIVIVTNAMSLDGLNADAAKIIESLTPNEEKLAELEEKHSTLIAKKIALETESPSASKLQLSDDYKNLMALYSDLYAKYN